MVSSEKITLQHFYLNIVSIFPYRNSIKHPTENSVGFCFQRTVYNIDKIFMVYKFDFVVRWETYPTQFPQSYQYTHEQVYIPHSWLTPHPKCHQLHCEMLSFSCFPILHV